MEDVLALADPVLRSHDVVVVEGLVPSSEQVYSSRVNLALAKALDADVLLVGAVPDGDLERMAEAMAMTEGTYRAGEDVRVVGALVNKVPDVSEAAVARVQAALQPPRHPAGRGRSLPRRARAATGARPARRPRAAGAQPWRRPSTGARRDRRSPGGAGAAARSCVRGAWSSSRGTGTR